MSYISIDDYDASVRFNGKRNGSEMEWGDGFTMGGLGIAGEAGEVADLAKKQVFHAHPWNTDVADKLEKELGDVLWYVAATADSIGVTLDEVATMNVEKLRARYPAGFDPERSKNRVDP